MIVVIASGGLKAREGGWEGEYAVASVERVIESGQRWKGKRIKSKTLRKGSSIYRGVSGQGSGFETFKSENAENEWEMYDWEWCENELAKSRAWSI